MNKILKSVSMQITITDEFATLKMHEGEIKVKIGENNGTEASALMLYLEFISAFAVARGLNPINELEIAYRVINKTKDVNFMLATILASDLHPVKE